MTLSFHEILESAETPKKTKGCRNGCGGCFIILLILALPFWWFCLHVPPLKVSKETTYVLGPMSSDGKQIDYFSALEKRLYPPEMKTDDNGCRMMVRACGVDIRMSRNYHDLEKGWHEEKIDPEPIRLQVYEKLGLDPNIKPTLKITPPWRLIEQYDNEHPQTEAALRMRYQYQHAATWTFEQFPMLQTWLEENTAGIDLLAEAVRKPIFCVPNAREKHNGSLAESWLFSNGIQMMREWARAAHSRAKYRLGIGDIDGAIDDTVTIFRLARHTEKQGNLVSALTGFAIESMGRSIGIASNPDFPPTAEQMKRLVAEIDALPPLITLKEIFEYDRIYRLSNAQDMYFEDIPTNVRHGLSFFYNKNIVLKKINDGFDMILFDDHPDNEHFKNSSFEEAFSFPSGLNFLFSFLFVRSRSEMFANNLAYMTFPAVQACRETWRRQNCESNMHRLTSALWLYEKEHGNMPDGDWREAIKPYLGENPEQYFRCPAKNLAEDETTYTMIEGVTYSASSAEQIILIEVPQPQKLGEGNGRIPLEDVMAMLFQEDIVSLVDSVHPNRIIVGYHSGQVTSLQFHMKLEDDLRKLLEGDTE